MDEIILFYKGILSTYAIISEYVLNRFFNTLKF